VLLLGISGFPRFIIFTTTAIMTIKARTIPILRGVINPGFSGGGAGGGG
jgi:hypothetical protein